jgi:hypothetical protein
MRLKMNGHHVDSCPNMMVDHSEIVVGFIIYIQDVEKKRNLEGTISSQKNQKNSKNKYYVLVVVLLFTLLLRC